MPNCFLPIFTKNEWSLVRETPSSQKFKVTTSEGDELVVDVHYTMPKILNVSIACAGKEPSRYVMSSVMEDIAQIALKSGLDYAMIDYTLTCDGSMGEGNYSIDTKPRAVHQK